MENTQFPNLAGSHIKLLNCFLIVAQTGSFRLAAEQMSRSASAVSMQIKALEQALGFMLFERTTRRVELTTEGKRLADAARIALSGIETTLHNIRLEKGLGEQRIAVGFLPSLASIYVPRLLTEMRSRLPNLSVEVYEASSDKLLQMVTDGQIELGVGQLMETNSQLKFETLKHEPLLALFKSDLAPEYAVTNQISLHELCLLPLLLFDRSTAMRQLVNAAFETAGLSFITKYQCVNAHTLVAMAEVGLGAAILPASVISAIPSTGTIALPIMEPDLRRTIALIRDGSDVSSNAAKTLTSYIRGTILTENS